MLEGEEEEKVLEGGEKEEKGEEKVFEGSEEEEKGCEMEKKKRKRRVRICCLKMLRGLEGLPVFFFFNLNELM